MKRLKHGVLLVAAFLTLAVAMPVVVVAEDGDTPTSNTTSSNDDSDFEGQVPQVKRGDRVDKLRTYKIDELKERIAKYKEKLAAKLEAASEARLKERCKDAQGLVNKLTVRYSGLQANRTSAYEAIDTKLTNIIDRLETGGHANEAAELEAVQTVFNQKVDAFLAALADYQQALADVQELDCQADPTAFKAALETARSTRTDVANKAKDIRTYVVETIIPLLKTIKSKVGTTGQEN